MDACPGTIDGPRHWRFLGARAKLNPKIPRPSFVLRSGSEGTVPTCVPWPYTRTLARTNERLYALTKDCTHASTLAHRRDCMCTCSHARTHEPLHACTHAHARFPAHTNAPSLVKMVSCYPRLRITAMDAQTCPRARPRAHMPALTRTRALKHALTRARAGDGALVVLNDTSNIKAGSVIWVC